MELAGSGRSQRSRCWRNRAYKPAAEGVGVDGSRPYDLRHSIASLLIHAGESVSEVPRQMGSSPSVTLDTYAHVFDERDPNTSRDPVEAIEAARVEFDVRGEYAGGVTLGDAESRDPASDQEALCRTRTGDPLLTMEVLYQLS